MLLYYTLTSVVVPCSASGKAGFGSIPRKSICSVRVGYVGLLSKVNGLWVALFVLDSRHLASSLLVPAWPSGNF